MQGLHSGLNIIYRLWYIVCIFLFQRLHTFYTEMGWKPTRPNCIFNFGCTVHFGILAHCLGIYCHKCCYRLPLWITNGNTGYIHFCNFRHYFCTLYDQNIPCKTCWKVGWFHVLFCFKQRRYIATAVSRQGSWARTARSPLKTYLSWLLEQGWLTCWPAPI